MNNDKMKKNLKYLLMIAIIVLTTYAILQLRTPDSTMIPMIIGICFLLFFAFNMLFRNLPKFKSYFISPFNILTAKYRSKLHMDISIDLMHEKLIETMSTSTFEVRASNEENHEILATTSTTFKSWGENVYIELSEGGDGGTMIDFTSATLFQSASWGKNERNFEKLVKSIDDSLTI